MVPSVILIRVNLNYYINYQHFFLNFNDFDTLGML